MRVCIRAREGEEPLSWEYRLRAGQGLPKGKTGHPQRPLRSSEPAQTSESVTSSPGYWKQPQPQGLGPQIVGQGEVHEGASVVAESG